MEIRLARPDEYERLAEVTVAAYRRVYAGAGWDLPEFYEAELRDVAGRAVDGDVLVAVEAGDEADAGPPRSAGSDGRAGSGGRDGEAQPSPVLGGVTYVPGPASSSAEFDGEHTAGIRMLAVAPEAQGRGVGDALTRACIERARAAGKTQIVLHSTDWMTAAHRIYLRLGFERVPALDWDPVPGLHLRAFRLEL